MKRIIFIFYLMLPQINLANTINNYKTVSSRYIRKEFQKEFLKYYWKPYFGSRSFMILTTGGATIKYIEQQEE